MRILAASRRRGPSAGRRRAVRALGCRQARRRGRRADAQDKGAHRWAQKRLPTDPSIACRIKGSGSGPSLMNVSWNAWSEYAVPSFA